MKTKTVSRRASQCGHILLLVMVLTVASIVIYVGLAKWTANSVLINERHNSYNAALAAAEGASETALSYMVRDFMNQSFDPSRANWYAVQVPAGSWASAYEFGDGSGVPGRTLVQTSALTVTTNFDARFPGLYGLAYPCTVCSNARLLTGLDPVKAAVQEQFQLATIPLFQFAIFYSLDLEINPGPAMKITGKVHSNGTLYTAPGASLEYCDTVTAVGNILNDRNPDDPQYGLAKVAPVYDSLTNSHVPALTMPIASNNVPSAVRAILEVPPFGEDPASPTGKSRLYNQTDLIVTTTDTGVTVSAGTWLSFASAASDGINSSYSFVQTTNSFYDSREQKPTVITDIDVGALNLWMNAKGTPLNAQAMAYLGHPLSSIYVDDQRAHSGQLTVVRVRNGQQLPPGGLTVATSHPLYVQGNFNAPAGSLGTTNTSLSLPASLAGDAINILSGGWLDSNSHTTNGLSGRVAQDTTVNAALLAGIVCTTNASGTKHYSGGVENFPRFLEDWGGKTFSYNGSMVVMFPSQFATNFWVSPGSAGGVYGAPTRHWAFDTNFKDFHKLPPATPQVRQLLRGQWTVVAAQ